MAQQVHFLRQFKWCSPTPNQNKEGVDHRCKKRRLMNLFTPFTIPKKDNYDLCKIKTNNRKAVEKPFIDDFFRNLNMQKFDFVFD